MTNLKPNIACIFTTSDKFKSGPGGIDGSYENTSNNRIKKCSTFIKHSLEPLNLNSNIDFIFSVNVQSNGKLLYEEISQSYSKFNYKEIKLEKLIEEIYKFLDGHVPYEKLIHTGFLQKYIQVYQFIKTIEYFEKEYNKKYDYIIKLRPDLLIYNNNQQNNFFLSLFHQVHYFNYLDSNDIDKDQVIGYNGILGSSQLIYTGSLENNLYVDDRFYLINHKAYKSISSYLKKWIIEYVKETLSPERNLGKLCELSKISVQQSNFPVEKALYRDNHDSLTSQDFEVVSDKNWQKIFKKWEEFCETGNGFY